MKIWEHDIVVIAIIVCVLAVLQYLQVVTTIYTILMGIVAIGAFFITKIHRETGGKLTTFLAWFFGLFSMFVVILSAVQYKPTANLHVLGYSLVVVEFPSSNFPISIKPITLLFYSILAWFYFTVNTPYSKKRFMEMSSEVRTILAGCVLVVLAGSIYEAVWNFTAWGAMMMLSGMKNVDLLYVTADSSSASLVFTTKITMLLACMSAYFLYYLRQIDSKLSRSSSS